MAKGDVVKRGVIELVTPGVVLGDANMLAVKENSYLASVYFGKSITREDRTPAAVIIWASVPLSASTALPG